ncbi:L,D-transpeptidase [Candidatus Peribacteria bacterium]|nr:L,D-transpeptidase [Candidatus Peribacteria bacterium]
MSTITASLLAIIMSVPTAPQVAVPVTFSEPVPYEVSAVGWVPEFGDKVIVDTENNEGFLMHTDGTYMRFPVATGQRRFVYYIGRSYHAATPNWYWVARSLHIKGDRVTFGPSGRFLRLYKDGETNTAYGFHEYRTDEEMFGENDSFLPEERFESMGCIIVKHEMMDLIVATWEKNSEVLEVHTQFGIDDLRSVMLAFTQEETEKL